MTSLDWWLATYFVVADIAAAAVGQLITKLLLVRFASHKRIDDGSRLENGPRHHQVP